MDARQRRTRARLHAAILRLAAQAPVDTITMTALAREAGVHRSTLYEHAPTPDALLRQALLEELDELRAGLLEDAARDTDEAVLETTTRVLEHIRRHAGTYRRGLADDAGAASLHGMLSEHFLGSSRRLREQGRLRLPGDVRGVPDDVVADAALRFVAQGTVGVMHTWLESDDPQVPDFLRTYGALVPAWWRQG